MSEISDVDTSCYGKCADCPFVKREAEHIQKHEEDRDDIIRQAVNDDEIDQFVEMMNSLSSHFGDTEREDITPATVRAVGGLLDAALIEHMEDLKASIQERRRGCMGSIVLTGTTPEGSRMYSSNACTSPRLPNGTSLEEMYVHRDRI